MTDTKEIPVDVTNVVWLSDADVAEMDRRRDWVRKYPGFFGDMASPEAKLQMVETILKDKNAVEGGPFMLQSLGIILGDAIAQQKGMTWYMMDTSIGRGPGLGMAGTHVKILPVSVINDRVRAGETIDVRALFDYFCTSVDDMMRAANASQAS
jgi:hypothetical protein